MDWLEGSEVNDWGVLARFTPICAWLLGSPPCDRCISSLRYALREPTSRNVCAFNTDAHTDIPGRSPQTSVRETTRS